MSVMLTENCLTIFFREADSEHARRDTRTHTTTTPESGARPCRCTNNTNPRTWDPEPRDGLREGYDPPRNIHLHRQEKILRKYKKLEWKLKTVFPSLCSARSSISLKESSVAHKRLHARTLFQRSCRCIPGSIAKIGKARKTG